MNCIQLPRSSIQRYIRELVLFCICGACLLFYYNIRVVNLNLYSVSVISSAPDGEKLHAENVSKVNSTNVLVLIWTPYFDLKSVSMSNYGIDFNIKSYPDCFRSCEITDDRSKLDRADAVIFHAWDLNKRDLPETRKNGQLWVIMYQEAPFSSNANLDSWSGIFNWTMTYRMDSDVFHPYGEIEEIPDSIKHETKVHTEIDSLVSRKTKLVAGAMSNCKTQSKRETLVSQLKTHILVDIFGKCGISACGRFAKNCNEDDFWKDITRQYKFFLAFENSLCVDYVTEKLFRTLELGIVPVVYGGANYTKFAPPHSFIDVSDFESTMELADFLTKLDKNETEYRKYLEWRLKYRVKTIPGYCTLCRRLKKIGREKLKGSLLAVRTYHYLSSWWLNYPPPIESIPSENKIVGSKTTPSGACKDAQY